MIEFWSCSVSEMIHSMPVLPFPLFHLVTAGRHPVEPEHSLNQHSRNRTQVSLPACLTTAQRENVGSHEQTGIFKIAVTWKLEHFLCVSWVRFLSSCCNCLEVSLGCYRKITCCSYSKFELIPELYSKLLFRMLLLALFFIIKEGTSTFVKKDVP